MNSNLTDAAEQLSKEQQQIISQMNDLRLLLQIDKSKKVISLEFKQITTLQPMIPLLEKFLELQSLSLHGNRLKSLPQSMERLENLAELDLSNNLFHEIDDVISSLKTLHSLTHLLYSFRSREEEEYLRSELPKLERLNKKPVQYRNTTSHNVGKKKESAELSEQDLEEVGQIYDQIRDVYRQSKYMVDKELAEDFDKNVEAIMDDLRQQLATGGDQSSTSNIIVCCKYSLLDICFVKLITYFYHFDKKIAVALEKIHDYQANMFKQLTHIIHSEVDRARGDLANLTLKKEQIYQKEIKRLRAYEVETQAQIQELQNRNKKIIERMVRIGKSQILESSLGRGQKSKSIVSSPYSHSKTNRSPTRYPPPHRNASELVVMPSTQKQLSLHQLKEIICEIMVSKEKHNHICLETGHVMETTEAHMYTYLNQKYGLKSITVDWAMNIVNGIRRYGLDDAQVAVFGKILRNEVDEHFFGVLRKNKHMLRTEIGKFKGNVAYTGEAPTQEELISVHEAEEILLNMQLKRGPVNLVLSRIRQESLVNNCLTAQSLDKVLMAHMLKSHCERIEKIRSTFVEADVDEDGVICTDDLEAIVQTLRRGLTLEEFTDLLDPHNTSSITFSHFCECIFYNHEFRQFFDADDMNAG